MGKQWLTLFFWAPKSLQIVIAAMKLKDAYSLEGKLQCRLVWAPSHVVLRKGEKSLVPLRTVEEGEDPDPCRP